MTKAKVKIALIGPVLPFRGGIAQYTGQLAAALQPVADCRVYSFSRLYPKFLYPGKSDKEPGRERYRQPGVNYSLSIFSPLSWFGTARQIAASGAEVAIVTWWTLIWQPGLALLAWRLRRRGVKVVFLCHNLYDHDATGLKRRLSIGLLRQADAYIVHDSQEAGELAAIKPAAPVLQRDTIPVYDQFPAPTEHWPKRGRLELLFFGFIRPYKGLEVLLRALAELNDPAVYLTVVGEAWGDVAALRAKLEAIGAPNVELNFAYASETDAANYFARADVVLLPYLTATGSAVLSLAYHYGKPVIASNVGGFRDAVKPGKTGWLVEPNDPPAITGQLAGLSRGQAAALKPAIGTFCRQNSWAGMAEAVVKFAKDVTP